MFRKKVAYEESYGTQSNLASADAVILHVSTAASQCQICAQNDCKTIKR